jgi:hypothetical protein
VKPAVRFGELAVAIVITAVERFVKAVRIGKNAVDFGNREVRSG